MPFDDHKIAVLQELEAFLAPRIADAQNDNIISSSAYEIFEETLADL